MAHTKAQKATKGNRDSKAKRLGVKIYGGQKANVGNVLIRQRGTQVHPGKNTKKGADDTIYALKKGTVEFIYRQGKKYIMINS